MVRHLRLLESALLVPELNLPVIPMGPWADVHIRHRVNGVEIEGNDLE